MNESIKGTLITIIVGILCTSIGAYIILKVSDAKSEVKICYIQKQVDRHILETSKNIDKILLSIEKLQETAIENKTSLKFLCDTTSKERSILAKRKKKKNSDKSKEVIVKNFDEYEENIIVE